MAMTRTFDLPREPFRLISYLGRYRNKFWIQAAGGILYNTVIVAGPIFIGRMLDSATAIEQLGPSPERLRAVGLNAVLFVLVTVFFQFARYVKRWYIRDMSNRIACDMSAGLLSSLLGRPMAQLERESVGDLMSRTVGDVNQIVTTMQTTINEIWDTWLLMLSYLVVLLVYSPRITLLCAIPIPIALYVAESARHPLYRFATQARRAAAQVNSHLQRMLNGISILRLFGREDVEAQRLKELSITQMSWNIKTSLLQTGIMPIYATLASLGVIGVIGLGGQEVISGSWSLGRFTSYLIMFMAMSMRTAVAARVLNQFHTAKAAWDRVKEKLAENPAATAAETQPQERPKTSHSPARAAVATGVGLRVDNLRFSFTGASHDALEGISFNIPAGSLVGITGAVGSGKSALAAALTGLYPYAGSIRLDGRELRELDDTERVASIAYSGQDAFIFSSSIAQSIIQRPTQDTGHDDARLQAALHSSALVEDLALFPEGLDTLVGERGVRISGGQRQRIALARALYAGCPLLILDDPFSAVDIGTERRIIDRLRTGALGQTVLVFSHRLAAFTQADWVLVLDRGRLIEQGTHEALMAAQGVYHRIYTAQAWLERETHGQI
jgi:ATP-binding cassette subfamily B multidrug efflux pump